MPASILIVDDHTLFRAGMALLIELHIIDVHVLQVHSVQKALELGASPAVILLDIQLANGSGLDGIIPLQQKWPQAKIIMVSALFSEDNRRIALARGAFDFIAKACSADTMINAINAALAHEAKILPAKHSTRSPLTQAHLTARQQQVLNLVSKGCSNKVIGRTLDIAENTVRVHIQAILLHFGVATRAEAVCVARARGLITPELAELPG